MTIVRHIISAAVACNNNVVKETTDFKDNYGLYNMEHI